MTDEWIDGGHYRIRRRARQLFHHLDDAAADGRITVEEALARLKAARLDTPDGAEDDEHAVIEWRCTFDPGHYSTVLDHLSDGVPPKMMCPICGSGCLPDLDAPSPPGREGGEEVRAETDGDHLRDGLRGGGDP